MNIKKRITLLSFCALTACTTTQKPAEAPAQNKVIPVAQRQAKTNMVSSFEIQGAMAAKSNKKGWSASLNWVQTGANNYQIRLLGPIGSGTVLINRQGGVVTFQDGAKKSTSNNADELLAQQTGIRLPVNHLYYWVRGLPAPGGNPSTHYDQFNHLVQLQQSGYSINFTRYTSVNGVDLPSMIHLQGNGVMVKVVIKQWKI
jgi:outer membrane lipoprotein LolB